MQVLCIFLFWRYFPSRNCPPISVLKLFEVLAHHVRVFKRIETYATRNIWYWYKFRWYKLTPCFRNWWPTFLCCSNDFVDLFSESILFRALWMRLRRHSPDFLMERLGIKQRRKKWRRFFKQHTLLNNLCWNTLSITSIKQHQTLALTAKKSVREKKNKNDLLPVVS